MGVFSFIGDIVNDVFGGSQSRKESNQMNQENMFIQEQYALDNMAVQNQYNIDAFNRENAYNTPLAQQERLRAAGINPNWTDAGTAIAQQDSGMSPSSPSGGMPSGSNTDVLGDVANLLQVGANIRKTKADAKLAESQTRLNDSQTRANDFALELDREYRSAERSKVLEIGDSQISLNSANQQLAEKESQQVFGKAMAEIQEKLSHSDNLDAQTKQILELIKPTIQNLYASTQNLLAGAYKSQVEAQYIPIHYQQEQQRINLQKEANQIAWKTASSLSDLQHSEARNFDADTISKKILNGVSAWAYEKGYSRRDVKNMSDKIFAEVQNAWNQFHKENPDAKIGDFFSRGLDFLEGASKKIIESVVGVDDYGRGVFQRGHQRGYTYYW